MPYKCSIKRREYHKEWHIRNRDRILKKQKEYRYKLKLEVLSFYCSKDIECECCGEETIEFLSIDHINGGGTKHRNEIGKGYLYFWLKKNNFPEGYRVLCYNCNQAVSIYGKCPHIRIKSFVNKRV